MSDAIGRPDRPLEVTVPPEHAALLRGPALADAVDRLVNMWVESPQSAGAIRGRYNGLGWALDALARAAGRDVP